MGCQFCQTGDCSNTIEPADRFVSNFFSVLRRVALSPVGIATPSLNSISDLSVVSSSHSA